MVALAYDPKNLTFVANGQSYMLVRQFKAPDRAKLPHVGHAAARKVVEDAVKANPNLAQDFNKTFSHNVGNVCRFNGTSNPVADAILQIQRKELYLLKLGAAEKLPSDVVAAAGGSVKIYKPFNVGDLARTGHGLAEPAIPQNPLDRLVLIVQGIAHLKSEDFRDVAIWEKVQALAQDNVIAALTTALTVFVMAQLSGPVAIILDSALLGYGLYTLGTGIFDFAEQLHDWWNRVTTARTRDHLKQLSVALAVILAAFVIARIIALLTRGAKKKGGGGKEEATPAGPPPDTKKSAPIPGAQRPKPAPPAPAPPPPVKPKPTPTPTPTPTPAAKKSSGRGGKQARLKELGDDPNVSSTDRGWIKQERNAIARGNRKTIRVPPGKELAHRRGFEAKKGFGYKHSDLQDKDLHKLQHKHEGY